jgi:cytochrome c oxidase subunit 2
VGAAARAEAQVNTLLRTVLDLPPQASTVARGLDTLHYVVISSAMLGALVITLLVAYFFVRYRERAPGVPDDRPRPPGGDHWRLEVALGVPTLALFLIYWVVGFHQYVQLRAVPPDALRVYVVAKQWMWEFAYPDGMTSEDELRVPVGQPIELVMTSRDVIHSFFVPSFRLKQDVVPGRMTTLWFRSDKPGEYDLLCAEFCGAGHSRMRGRILVVPPAEYARWAAGGGAISLAGAGLKIAGERGCLRCHTVDGQPHLGPTWRHLYGSPVSITGGTTVIADDAYLTESMMDPAAKIVTGFPPIMPSYQGVLSGPEAGAIVEYIRSLREAP